MGRIEGSQVVVLSVLNDVGAVVVEGIVDLCDYFEGVVVVLVHVEVRDDHWYFVLVRWEDVLVVRCGVLDY